LLSRLSGAVLLIQVEKSGQFWPFAACCAVSENTVLTSAREALQIGAWTRDPKSGFKAWVTHPASGLKLPVREIRFYAVSVATEKPDDWMFTNLGLIAVQGDLPKTAELAGPDDSAQLAQGNTVHVLGYTHEGDLTTPADHFEVDETPARILFIETHRDLPGKPRRLAIKAELPKSALGSPVVNAQGKVVAVYCDPTAVAEAGADEKGKPPGTQNMHYATVINPGVIDLWVKKSDTSMWVSTTDLKLPAQSLAARDVLVPPNWGWGPWGWGHGGWHHGGTPLSYTIEARASLVAAQGEFLESVAIARRIHADAYALEIQNAVEEVKAYFERRRMNREIVLQEKGNRPDIIRDKTQKAMETYVKRDLHDLLKQTDPTKQLNWLLAELCGPTMAVQYLGGSEALPDLNERLTDDAKAQIWLTDGGRAGSRLEFRLGEGKALDTPWPAGLRRERFDPLRAEFEAARDELVKEVEATGRVSEPTRDRLIMATNGLLVTLEEVFPSAERQESSVFLEYHAAKQYLRSLVAQVNRAVSTNDRSVFSGSLRFQGNTILELIQHMYQSGLVFASPKEGGERIYRNLVQSLRNVYVNLPNVRPQAGGARADTK
jgi:hypothetical protein